MVVSDDVKLVEDDLGRGQLLPDHGAVRPAAIHARGYNALPLRRRELGEEGLQALLLAPFGRMEQLAAAGVEHHGDVALLAFMDGFLIDQDRFQPVQARLRMLRLQDVAIPPIGGASVVRLN